MVLLSLIFVRVEVKALFFVVDQFLFQKQLVFEQSLLSVANIFLLRCSGFHAGEAGSDKNAEFFCFLPEFVHSFLIQHLHIDRTNTLELWKQFLRQLRPKHILVLGSQLIASKLSE